ncbi:MAG: hypothetical protein JWN41_1603 [Thermoleophilia bacterium]|nr:hypothetical protein [Thermoleophilia bacterium]
MTIVRTRIILAAVSAALVVACAGALAAVPAAHAASSGPIGVARAAPAVFVPDWNGDGDSTAVTYRLISPSAVTVAVLDSRGTTRRTLLRGRQVAGGHTAYWDGRDAAGHVLSVGTYRVRVTAQPITVSGARARARSLASGASRRDLAVALRAAPVAVRAVHLSRGSIGRSTQIGATRASFTLTSPAFVNAAIVGADGRVQRTLSSGVHAAGAQTAAWAGTDASGHPVADGMYELLVAASQGARPTVTLWVPLRVDRTLPTIKVAAVARASARAGRDSVVPLAVTVSERSTVRIKLGNRGIKVAANAGTRRFSIHGSTLGIARTARARTVAIFVSATDLTGNQAASRVTVAVPAAAGSTPHTAPPARTQPAAGPPVVTGKLAWPLHRGILINSSFGPRWGKMHTGIDLEASIGTPVYSASDGRVSYVGGMSGYGNVVVVDHANSLQTYYAHLTHAATGLVVGDAVQRGQLIGVSGCSGTCTGPHLHFEVRVGGAPRDPMAFMPPA